MTHQISLIVFCILTLKLTSATLPTYPGQGIAINPNSACAEVDCYQELPDGCCPLPYNYQGSFLGAQSNLVSILGFWKTLFAQTACQERCQSLIFPSSGQFRTCVHANQLYAENFNSLLNSNVCNGACLYNNKEVWQRLTNVSGPCAGISTQPGFLSCPSGCREILTQVDEGCRAAASTVAYQAYGDFLNNAFRACGLTVPRVCEGTEYAGCMLNTDINGFGSSAGANLAAATEAQGGSISGS